MSLKLKGCKLYLTIVAFVTAVMSFVSLAFKFMLEKTPIAETSYNLSDSMDKLSTLNKLGIETPTGITVGRVFMIITLVAVALLAVLLVVKMFVSNKILNLIGLALACLTLVCAVIFFICLLVGFGQLTDKLAALHTSCYAYVAVYLVAAFSVATAVLGGIVNLKK